MTRLLSLAILALAAVLPAHHAAAEGNPVVVIETNFGDIKAELFPSKSPLTVENFLRYVEEGFYEGTIFHRVEKGSLIQGGSLTPALQQKKAHPPIKSEATNQLKNLKGTLAMARSGGIHSATAQFFINTRDNRQFDHHGMSVNKYGYTVFGRVVEGADVVETIEHLKTTKRNKMRHVPTVPVIIKKVRLESTSQ